MLQFLVLALLLAGSQSLPSSCPADENEPWTYRGKNGPEFWGDTYPVCKGDQQSPIVIDSVSAEKDENLAKLALNNYDQPITKAKIENNGHTIELQPADGVERTISVNGETYRFHQLHFHWGSRKTRGSEHVLDGVRYEMEMHLVHMTEANKIAVVGVFFEETLKSNENLQPIVGQLHNLMYKGDKYEFDTNLNLNNLVPANPTSFYRYAGSLTTPKCAEGVTWSVIPDPLPVGKLQMAEFRKLFSTTKDESTIGCTLSDNFRPVQQLNDRQVYLSQ